VNERNGPLIKKLTSRFTPLSRIGVINRGLITGDREKFFSTTKKSPDYVPLLQGGDVHRYWVAEPSQFVRLEKPDSAGGSWDAKIHLAPHKILIRQIAECPTATIIQAPLAVTGNLFTVRASSLKAEFYILGIINSRVTDFFWRTMFADFKTSFPQVTVFSLAQLPIKPIDAKSKHSSELVNQLVSKVRQMLEVSGQFQRLPAALQKKISLASRTRCPLAHYLQRDYAEAVTAEMLIDDVQRRGFVHQIGVQSANNLITLSAYVSDEARSEPRLTAILRLKFSNESLRQFIYAMWQTFLDENSRKRRWTTGTTPQAIYQLILNTLEPLVFFHPTAADNLKAIRGLMNEVGKEAGTPDLASVEMEIAATDQQINQVVYELYGLTPEEKAVVEETAK
jgi:hypothetical protein